MKGIVPFMVIGLGFIIVVASATFSIGKPNPTRELLKLALERYQQGQYYEAIHFYQKVLSIDSAQQEAHYYVGDCYRYLFQYELALKHYQQIQQEQLSEYPLLGVNMGLVHKSLGNYDQAERYFTSFLQEIPKRKASHLHYWVERAKRELASLSFIQQAPLTPITNASLIKLPSPLNSDSHDLAAVPYRECNALMITSTRSDSKGNRYHDQHGESFSDNFLFLLDSNRWRDRSTLHQFSAINTKLDEGPGVVSSDGQTYYFARFTTKGDYHLFSSNFADEEWQSPHPLPAPINLPGYISKHPALSASGDTLIFSSNRPGGFGESDLWMSVRQQDSWQEPVNLGSSINTPYQETSPHWSARQRMLFFASDGHPGWGGYDLFMTPLRSDLSPSQVVNLGKPLNSSKDDTYIWVGENTGYITSNRDSTAGNFDIFMYHYSNEPKLLLSLTTQSFWDVWAASLHTQSANEELGESQRFFSTLSSQAQHALQRSVQRRIFQALQADDVLSEAMMEEAQQVLTTHQGKIQKMVDDQLAFYLSFQIPSWSEDTQRWFSTLDPEEKERIERATQVLVLKALLQPTDGSSSDAEESYVYEALTSEERLWVEQATERGVRYFQKVADEFVGLDELYQWQTLPAQEKDQLRRELTYRYFASLARSDETSTYVQHQYEQLPYEQQQQIDRMARALVLQERNRDSLGLNGTVFLLDTLSPEEQRTLASLVVYRSEELRKKHDSEVHADVYAWDELPSEAKHIIQRAASTRRFVEQAVSDLSLAVEPHRQQINLHSLLQTNPDVVTIRGKLRQRSPMADPISVSLGNAYEQLDTKTQADGTFIFERVNYHQSQQLFIGDQRKTMTDMLSFYLEELEITVVQDSQFIESFDNIYFETNKHQLTSEAEPVLERVAGFHHRHPDITIQIHAYADSVGSQTFNYQLSERRGKAVFQSLLQRGVHPEALVVVPKGKEELSATQALSYSRRVEFIIAGVNTVYNPTRKIYLLAANPDLNEVARRYGVTLDEILALNPGLSLRPSSYSIITIITNQFDDK